MTEADSPVGALDIGSNTVRLLVARPAGDGLESLLDLGAYPRLGRGVDTTGLLADETQEKALESIADFVQQAREAGADEIAAVATSAIRDARNGPQFAERVEQRTGVRPQIISGDREAELTFLGATLGRRPDGATVVVDLGGGSGEVIAAEDRVPAWGKSLRIGSGRLTERFVHSDPATGEQLTAVAEYVRTQLDTLPEISPRQGIVVGGTANVLPGVLGKPGPPAEISQRDLDHLLSVVTEASTAELSRRYELPPERGQVLPAGAAALAEITRFYRLGAISIPGTGIREGMIIDVLRKQGR